MLNITQVDKRLKSNVADDLAELPIIVRVNEFDENSAKKFVIDLSKAHGTGQPVIPVVIDSYGGDVYALLAMVDAIKTATVPVATIVEGKAMSCGAILLSCGKDGLRFAGPNATIMIHEVATAAPFKKVEEVKVDAKETERLNVLIMELMAENCNKPKSYFLNQMHTKGHADWYLTAKEALKHKLVNHVRIPSLKTKLSVVTTLE